MSVLDIDAIEARADAATEGPWVWGGTVKEPYLCTKYCGRIFILVPRRSGMQGGTVFVQEPGGRRIVPASKYAVRQVPYRNDITHIDHPDCEFIAHAREDVPALIAEVRLLRAVIDKAAHRFTQAKPRGDGECVAGECICGEYFSHPIHIELVEDAVPA